ncbi:hypothetical protein K474DRAFT_133384 [Panus rudis PR-1116 ss-1]|nr:hypothetical protein K474DRAFT_133384 [Panus rudis PR-1116 ss-1]
MIPTDRLRESKAPLTSITKCSRRWQSFFHSNTLPKLSSTSARSHWFLSKPHSNINDLPTELLGMIFTFALASVPERDRDVHLRKEIYTITLVCRRWRDVADAFPELWAYVLIPSKGAMSDEIPNTIQTPSSPDDLDGRAERSLSDSALEFKPTSFERFRCILNKSGSQPLHVYTVSSQQHREVNPSLEYLSEVLKHLSRIQTLEMPAAVGEYGGALWKAIPNEQVVMPKLKSLSLYLLMPHGPNLLPYQYALTQFSRRVSMPHLDTLSLSDFPMWACRSYLCNTLTRLKLKWTVATTTPDIYNIADILKGMPRLTSLSLEQTEARLTEALPNSLPRVQLPNLNHVRLALPYYELLSLLESFPSDREYHVFKVIFSQMNEMEQVEPALRAMSRFVDPEQPLAGVVVSKGLKGYANYANKGEVERYLNLPEPNDERPPIDKPRCFKVGLHYGGDMVGSTTSPDRTLRYQTNRRVEITLCPKETWSVVFLTDFLWPLLKSGHLLPIARIREVQYLDISGMPWQHLLSKKEWMRFAEAFPAVKTCVVGNFHFDIWYKPFTDVLFSGLESLEPLAIERTSILRIPKFSFKSMITSSTSNTATPQPHADPTSSPSPPVPAVFPELRRIHLFDEEFCLHSCCARSDGFFKSISPRILSCGLRVQLFVQYRPTFIPHHKDAAATAFALYSHEISASEDFLFEPVNEDNVELSKYVFRLKSGSSRYHIARLKKKIQLFELNTGQLYDEDSHYSRRMS